MGWTIHLREMPQRYEYFKLMHSWISCNKVQGRDFCTTDLSTLKSKKRSNLEVMALSEDFSLPPDLLMPFEIHSAVLRIATGLCMWLHYDVCDNFLCCIHGPDDIGRLYISGSSSALGSRLGRVLGRVSIGQRLFAGDVLFLPVFWPPQRHCHTCRIKPVFVLHPETMALHDPKDIWANWELLPAQETTKVFEKKVLPSL